MKISKCNNVADMRRAARSRLPSPIFDYLDGGADDEWTLSRNTTAFDQYELMPRYLRNIEHIDLKTQLLGTTIDMPLFIAPTGMSRLFHHEKELAVAQAAAKFGTIYSLSTLGTCSIEEVAEAGDGPGFMHVEFDLAGADRNRVVRVEGEYEYDYVADRRPDAYGSLTERPPGGTPTGSRRA